jgi:hypothetical protein
MSKKLIALTITTEDDTDIEYIGRFLGFLKDDEFNALTQNKKVAHKIESRGTKDFLDVCDANDNLNGKRLVMAVKKIGGKGIVGKKLFVTEKLDYITQTTGNEVLIMTEDGTPLEIEEKS